MTATADAVQLLAMALRNERDRSSKGLLRGDDAIRRIAAALVAVIAPLLQDPVPQREDE